MKLFLISPSTKHFFIWLTNFDCIWSTLSNHHLPFSYFSLFYVLIHFSFFIFWTSHYCVDSSVKGHVWVSKGNLQRSILYFNNVNPGDLTWAMRRLASFITINPFCQSTLIFVFLMCFLFLLSKFLYMASLKNLI